MTSPWKNLENSAAYLASAEALESIARNPYWPKYHSPWWHMQALWELGQTALIPQATALALAKSVNTFYLPFFPSRVEDVPPGKDPGRHVACHCELGMMYQVLAACGIDVENEIPWLRPWFLKYQLPDGGLNCDEAHYAKENPCSSIISTLPCLEALLRAAGKPLSAEELLFLDKGAEYLLRHRLYRRKSTGAVMDPAFTAFIFPRFYGYDVLRGLSFLVDWAAFRGVTLPAGALEDPLQALREKVAAQGFKITRSYGVTGNSFVPQGDGAWSKGKAESFPLLDELRESTDPDGIFSRELERVSALLG